MIVSFLESKITFTQYARTDGQAQADTVITRKSKAVTEHKNKQTNRPLT